MNNPDAKWEGFGELLRQLPPIPEPPTQTELWIMDAAYFIGQLSSSFEYMLVAGVCAVIAAIAISYQDGLLKAFGIGLITGAVCDTAILLAGRLLS